MKKNINLYTFTTVVCHIFLIGMLCSCSQSRMMDANYVYFNNGADTVTVQQKETVIQPNDLLSIQVFSRTLNQEQAAIFNIPSSANGVVQGYQVNAAGDLELPVIGPLQAAGLTKDQLQTMLAEKLTNYVKNASVLVRFLQFNVNILGEVRSPGTQKFLVDRVTIIDALSAAGDLTDFGRREDVMVIREEKGRKMYYTVDLRSKAVFRSPVYVLQPNDIVYVRPNKYRLKSLSIDPDVQRKTSIFFTVFSFALNIFILIRTFIR